MGMSDSSDQDAIVVTGSKPTEWGYNLDVTDRGTGEAERRWIDDRTATVSMPKHGGQTVETNIAPDATLTLRGNNGQDVIMPRVEADTATTVNIEGRDGNDVIAPTTRKAEQPYAANAPRPQVNINGGAGDDTVVLGGVSPENVVIQRVGDGYKVTDGTGTDLNLKQVEFIKGRSQENAREPAAGALPSDTRGVDLAGLELKEGEGIRLSDAQKPLYDTRVIQAEAQTRSNYDASLAKALENGDYDPKLEMRSVRLAELGPNPSRETIAPDNVAAVRSDIEQQRGSGWER